MTTATRAAAEADGTRHRDHRFSTPCDLRSQNHGSAPRALLVGSCAMGMLPSLVPPEEGQIDFLNVGNGGFLPSKSAEELACYDFQIIQIPLRVVITDKATMRLGLEDEAGAKARFDEAWATLEFVLNNITAYVRLAKLPAFIANLPVPQQNPNGRFAPRYSFRNPVFFFEELNRLLYNAVEQMKDAYTLDLDRISATFGRKTAQDDSLTCFTHGAFLSEFDAPLDANRLEALLPATVFYEPTPHVVRRAIWEEAVAMYRTLRGFDNVKAVIIDLDDTLWRGIPAEMDSIDQTQVEGWPIGFAEALLYVKARGVLLAIVSRNDPERIKELWPSLYMDRIRLDDFASVRISWDFKPQNVAKVLNDLSILPRNAVFIDDNPVERDAVSRAFPGIRTLGANPYILRRVMLWAPELQTPSVSEESLRRTEMVQAQIQREEQRATMAREDFLASIAPRILVFRLHPDAPGRFNRAFELLNKTNQFNTSGQRWAQHDFEAIADAGDVYAFEVKDAHTSYGLVGVVIVNEAEILQAVMSCRVLGLDAEIGALSVIVESLPRPLKASIVETDANMPVRDLWLRAGFRKTGPGSFALSGGMECPAHISVELESASEHWRQAAE